jgi:serine phosphatase RsbU (regulator of sigma subunit)
MEEQLSILVVDDEPFNVDYLVQEIEDLGVKTITAGDGLEALKQVQKHSPDLVLLDIMMPKMDGFEVLSEIKANENQRDIPVIIISAHSDMDKVLKGIEMGAEDYLPKPFDPLLLKARVNASLEKKRFRNLEKTYLESIERELHIGRDIQAGFLPEKIPAIKGWNIETYFKAAKEVSGDFYDVFELPDGHIVIGIGDVTDKGVGSALYMALYRSLLRASMLEEDASSTVERLKNAVERTNTYICNNHIEPRFLTLFYGVLEPKSGSLDYISAGHDHPFLIDLDGKITEIKPTGPLIGMLAKSKFEVAKIEFANNMLLFVYTDGATDVINGEEKTFGKSRLKKFVTDFSQSKKKLVGELVEELSNYSGISTQYDDITLLSIERR